MSGEEGVTARLRLDGRICVVTGGARGIGAAIASWLDGLGGRCVIADVGCDSGEEHLGRYRLDVTDSAAIAAMLDDVVERHGRIDVMVTSAGIAAHGSSLELRDESWERVLAVNATGTFTAAREAIRRMGPGGSVVCIGSMSGVIANVPQRQTAYNASKAAVHAIVRSLGVEFAAAGIRVNAVAPGYIETEMTATGVPSDWLSDWRLRTPMARMGSPEEVAGVVGFLASDVSSYMTGTTVIVDGGYTAV